jgi:hypothetical protein
LRVTLTQANGSLSSTARLAILWCQACQPDFYEPELQRIVDHGGPAAVSQAVCSVLGPLHSDDLALTAGAGLIVFVALESLKLMWRAKVQA